MLEAGFVLTAECVSCDTTDLIGGGDCSSCPPPRELWRAPRQQSRVKLGMP